MKAAEKNIDLFVDWFKLNQLQVLIEGNRRPQAIQDGARIRANAMKVPMRFGPSYPRSMISLRSE